MTALLPITYQKLNDDWDVHARVPKTTLRLAGDERLEDVAEVGGAVLEVGVEDRGELLCRVLERGSHGRALAEVPLVVDDASRSSGHSREPRSSRVPSVEPSSTTTSSRLVDGQLGGERVVDRRLDGRALVEDGHEDGEAPGHCSVSSTAGGRRPTALRRGCDATEQELAGRADDRRRASRSP